MFDNFNILGIMMMGTYRRNKVSKEETFWFEKLTRAEHPIKSNELKAKKKRKKTVKAQSDLDGNMATRDVSVPVEEIVFGALEEKLPILRDFRASRAFDPFK